jgi:multidrug efflux pump subunit AcrA (membrane-fusion protein)
MCDVASEYLANLRLRSFQEQEKMWSQLERFVQSVHQKLNTGDTVYAIANEGRRLIDCDRVSVALMQGSRCVVKTVSGLDSIERRSEQVKTLGKLATAVVKTREPLWYDGDDKDLPPQIEKRIHHHVDKSFARMIAVVPLLDASPSDDETVGSELANQNAAPIGAIIVEQLKDAQITPALKSRVEVVVKHSQTALANSIDHQSIFLMPLWKSIGKVLRQFQGRRLIRTAAIAAAIGSCVAFLCLFPYPFSLGARGSLVPERQYEIYAQLDGTLDEINVSNTGDTLVEEGQLLATMSSTTLELTIRDLEGRIRQAENEKSIAMIGKTRGSDADEKAAYSFQFERAVQTIDNLTNELEVKMKDRELLKVRAPAAGQVVNWQVRQNLLRRPVRFGQHLMTIVPPDTQWLIELEMPERRLAHLAKAMAESDQKLKVTFALLSWPGKEFEGELISVDQKLDVYSDEGNAALVRVVFPNDVMPEELLKAGTRVTGKVSCGTEPIGYAMFYELIETVKSKWQFWF